MPNDTTTDGQHDHESDEKNTQTPDPGVVDALADAVTPLTTTDPDDPPTTSTTSATPWKTPQSSVWERPPTGLGSSSN
ncbi:MAG: hypothetical protein ACI8VE_001553 [Natrialbaceae archaeon]|jgi:hypothetical protein